MGKWIIRCLKNDLVLSHSAVVRYFDTQFQFTAKRHSMKARVGKKEERIEKFMSQNREKKRGQTTPLWFRATKNPDVKSGPLVHPFPHTLLFLFARPAYYFLHSLFYSQACTIFGVFLSGLDHSELEERKKKELEATAHDDESHLSSWLKCKKKGGIFGELLMQNVRK